MKLIDDEQASSVEAVRHECADALRSRIKPDRLREDLLAIGYLPHIVDEGIFEYSHKLASRVRSENLTWRIIGGFVFLVNGAVAVLLLVALPGQIVFSAPLLFGAMWGACVMCDPRWAWFSPFGSRR